MKKFKNNGNLVLSLTKGQMLFFLQNESKFNNEKDLEEKWRMFDSPFEYLYFLEVLAPNHFRIFKNKKETKRMMFFKDNPIEIIIEIIDNIVFLSYANKENLREKDISNFINFYKIDQTSRLSTLREENKTLLNTNWKKHSPKEINKRKKKERRISNTISLLTSFSRFELRKNQSLWDLMIEFKMEDIA